MCNSTSSKHREDKQVSIDQKEDRHEQASQTEFECDMESSTLLSTIQPLSNSPLEEVLEKTKVECLQCRIRECKLGCDLHIFITLFLSPNMIASMQRAG